MSVWWPMQSFRLQMKGLLSGAAAGSPSSGRCSSVLSGADAVVSFQGQMSSIFMKFTWHANLHYRYL